MQFPSKKLVKGNQCTSLILYARTWTVHYKVMTWIYKTKLISNELWMRWDFWTSTKSIQRLTFIKRINNERWLHSELHRCDIANKTYPNVLSNEPQFTTSTRAYSLFIAKWQSRHTKHDVVYSNRIQHCLRLLFYTNSNHDAIAYVTYSLWHRMMLVLHKFLQLAEN